MSLSKLKEGENFCLTCKLFIKKLVHVLFGWFCLFHFWTKWVETHYIQCINFLALNIRTTGYGLFHKEDSAKASYMSPLVFFAVDLRKNKAGNVKFSYLFLPFLFKTDASCFWHFHFFNLLSCRNTSYIWRERCWGVGSSPKALF